MGVISRMMKSVLFSGCSYRRMSSFSSSSIGRRRNDLFLASRFTHETEDHYFSLVSTANWATVRDFHSPLFGWLEIGISSCEGLVLLHHTPNDEHLWNPSTNEFKPVPPSYVARPPNKAYYTIYNGAFGFDSQSRDYKIIRFVNNYFQVDSLKNKQLQIELYSLKNDSWKEIFDDPTHRYFSSDPLSSLRCFYANGCCYWRMMKNKILSFDFANESFSCFSLPETRLFECKYNLVEFDGSLGVIAYVSSRKSTKEIPDLDGELWVLNNDDGSWTRKFEIHAAGEGWSKILGFSSDNQLLFLGGQKKYVIVKYEHYGISQLLAYDVGTQQIKKFNIYDYSYNSDMAVLPYFDSNVAFNGKSIRNM